MQKLNRQEKKLYLAHRDGSLRILHLKHRLRCLLSPRVVYSNVVHSDLGFLNLKYKYCRNIILTSNTSLSEPTLLIGPFHPLTFSPLLALTSKGVEARRRGKLLAGNKDHLAIARSRPLASPSDESQLGKGREASANGGVCLASQEMLARKDTIGLEYSHLLRATRVEQAFSGHGLWRVKGHGSGK